MKIGLMGFEFSSANKGCEALTYSILTILKDIIKETKDVTIYNFSGTGLGIIPKYFNELRFVNVQPNIKDIKFNYIRKLMECDIILDVTMGDSFSDIYSENYYNGLVRHKRIAEFFGKKYILLPQTYGPFNTSKSERKAYNVLCRADKIFCRDGLSKDFLINKMNINPSNIELATDMAFLLPYDKKKYENSNGLTKIGINVSGLMYKGGFLSNNQFDLKLDYKKYIDDILTFFSNKENYEIHLISHVIDLNENSYDDDYKISKELEKKYNNCVVAPPFETPIEVKSYISNMDIFIGSRMHATIAAFSSGVLTIPVSYSRKFEGLFNSINYEYVINGKEETTESAFNKTLEYMDIKEAKEKQKKSLEIINNKNKEFIEMLNNEFKIIEK